MKVIQKIGLLAIPVLICTMAFAQTTCPQYSDDLKLARQDINGKRYEAALNDIILAQGDARRCQKDNPSVNVNLELADNLLKELISRQVEDAREDGKKQIKPLEAYILNMANLVQNSHSMKQGALLPALLEQITKARKYIDANNNSSDEEIAAELNRKLAESYELNGDQGNAFVKWEAGFQPAKKILEGPKTATNEQAWTSSLIICSEYANYLLDNGEITQANNVLLVWQGQHIPITASGFEAIARFEFAKGRYEEAVHGYAQAILHYSTAIRLAGKTGDLAAKNDQQAIFWTKCYNVMLLGSRLDHFRVDTIFDNNPVAFSGSIQKLRNSLTSNSSANVSMNNLRANFTSTLLSRGMLSDAKDSLINLISLLDPVRSTIVGTLSLKADVHAQLAVVYRRRKINDTAATETRLALKYWMAAIDTDKKENSELIAATGRLLEKDLIKVYAENEKLIFVRQMSESLKAGYGPNIKKFPDFEFLIAELENTEANLLEKKNTLQDSIKAYLLFDNATGHFHQSGELTDPASYRPDFAAYTHTASHKLLYEISHRMPATETTARFIAQEIMPLYRLNDFDVAMGRELTLAFNAYGHYLYNKGAYKQAIEPLEFASTHGMRSATEKLILIYQNHVNAPDKLTRFNKIVGVQDNDEPVWYRLPLNNNAASGIDSLEIYITEREKGYHYKGIDDVATWVKAAYNESIDQRYIDAFKHYQDVAWNEHRSFKALSVQAYEEADSAIFVLNKYTRRKTEIAKSHNVSNRLSLSADLFKRYNDDVAQDAVHAAIIKKDAATFGVTYANDLKTNGHTDECVAVYKRVLDFAPRNKDATFFLKEMEFNRNRNKFIKESYKGNFEQLKDKLSFFLIESTREAPANVMAASKAADNIKNKILQDHDDTETRDFIANEYSNVGRDLFATLFLDNKQDIRSFIDYFAKKNVDSLKNSDAKRDFYFHMIQLDQLYLNLNAALVDTVVSKLASTHCSSYVWFCLITKKGNRLRDWLETGQKFDRTNQLATGNLLSVYLFNNDFGDAKTEYDNNKDKTFSESGPFRTYRDYYTYCVAELRKSGLKNMSISRFSDMLIDHAENNPPK